MATVPDEAIDRMGEVTRAAFAVFVVLCRRADGSGIVPPMTLGEIKAATGLTNAVVKVSKMELLAKNFISVCPRGLQITGALQLFQRKEKEPKRKESTKFIFKYLRGDNINNNINNNISTDIDNSISINPDINNNINNNIGAEKKRKNGTRLPPDFEVTPAMLMWFESRGLTVDPEVETERFKNYWLAKAGKDATKMDWVATWRNWMLQAEGYSAKNHKGRTGTNIERLGEYEELFKRYQDSEGD